MCLGQNKIFKIFDFAEIVLFWGGTREHNFFKIITTIFCAQVVLPPARLHPALSLIRVTNASTVSGFRPRRLPSTTSALMDCLPCVLRF